jgi:ATP-dependent RNA helicase DeaD
MERFRAGKIRCLIATDVVGRGIDVTSISHIINFDTPQFCDDYVHRVGRTGRMGREGVAFTFVAPEEGPELTRIEQRINRQLKRGELTGFDATPGESRAASHADLSDDTQQATAATLPPPSPPFGRHSRRHRRAL